jgi:hypothetical protein
LAAQGWLELGNHIEAIEELENIAPQLRAHPGGAEGAMGTLRGCQEMGGRNRHRRRHRATGP